MGVGTGTGVDVGVGVGIMGDLPWVLRGERAEREKMCVYGTVRYGTRTQSRTDCVCVSAWVHVDTCCTVHTVHTHTQYMGTVH